ncbi:MAG: hypothetical protein QOF14_4854 [Hyphomicrobiales bacterium]|jgi:hypothetical protein|nr:hypothetical protein [Hyphomicrobiales bacterium]
MAKRLFVGVLGHRKAGKSTTWYELFGHAVRRGKNARQLILIKESAAEVFVVSGSFEERGEYADEGLDKQDARIVLCSIQYNEEGLNTIDYAFKNGFDVFIQWLNPGYHDETDYFDRLGLVNSVLARGGTFAIRDGKGSLRNRVREIREFIFGWAAYRGLLGQA